MLSLVQGTASYTRDGRNCVQIFFPLLEVCPQPAARPEVSQVSEGAAPFLCLLFPSLQQQFLCLWSLSALLAKEKGMTKAFRGKEKQRDPKPHVWHKANNSHDLYFCNPRPPLTLMPVVITQHVIVITSNLFLKVPIQCWRCLNTHWKYTKHMSSLGPVFPEEGLVSLQCTQHTYGMNKLWTIIIKNNLCLFIYLVYETDLSMTLKTLGDTHCGGVKTKLLFPLIFFQKLESKSQGRWHRATLLLLMWMGKDLSFYIKASWEEEVGGHEREKPWNYLHWFIRNSHSMGFWEGETSWKMCWCDSSGDQHIWAKAGMEQGGAGEVLPLIENTLVCRVQCRELQHCFEKTEHCVGVGIQRRQNKTGWKKAAVMI